MNEQESAVNSLLRDLYRENVIIHRGLDMHNYGKCSYTEALEIIIVQLAAVSAQQFEALVQAQIRSPYPASIIK